MNQFWTCNNTWHTRYDDFGVTGYMLSHLRDIKNAVVIDVGCSNGKAVLGSKQCLSKHGIDIYAIGIDISTRKNIITNAEKNLDEFINKNVLEVSQYVGKADVVVCLNATRLVSNNLKSEIIKKCAWFLKPNGVLITDVKRKYRGMLSLEEPVKSPPKRVCSRSLCSLIPSTGEARMMKHDGTLKLADIIKAE